ncbi:MAG: ATP-binding protein [Burkholderiales bacterium]|nr:ATP-binding protein [Burkholderiales bacterium]
MTAPSTASPPERVLPEPPCEPWSADIERQARAAQASLVFNRARGSNLMAPVVGALVCWLLWNTVDHRLLVGWFALLVLVAAWRETVHRCFLRDAGPNAARWGERYDVALFGAGVVYGLLGTVLLPRHEPATAAILLAAVVAIASVAMVVLSTKLRSTLAFALPVLVPTIVVELAQGNRLSIFAGLGMLVFLSLIAAEGRRASEHTLAMLRLRFRMDELAAQRQQALGLAQRSSAVKTQFLATMSHEMRTPLHGILGVTRLLRSARPDDSPASRMHRLEMIELTGEHLLGLINDVLDYSRIEGGHLRVEPADFDLTALVESVADLARVAAAEKGLALTLDMAVASPCWVHADASRLRQVLLNLTGNAVKFTEHGSIHLSLRRGAAGATTIEVTDTGSGIAADQHERVFEAFHQSDGSFGRRHGGTGLGLTISRELARALGGDLVSAEAPGGGARFVFTLPLPAGAPAVAPVRPADSAPALRGRVLVVEDNPVNALVTEALLLRTGVTVDLVADGLQAVARAASTRYDLILMDCQMPGMDGFEATARIRAAERAGGTNAVPIVALTANALESDRQRSLAAGMDEHFAKPFHEQALNTLLLRFLGPARC